MTDSQTKQLLRDGDSISSFLIFFLSQISQYYSVK